MKEDRPARPPRLDVLAIMELHQKNMAAMTNSWLVILDGFSAVAASQQEIAKATLDNMTEMMAGYRAVGHPQEAMGRQVEFAKKTIEATVAAARYIGEAMGQSGVDAAGALRQRIGAEAAAWMSDPLRRDKLVDLVVSKLPPIFAAVDKSGLPSFLGKQIRTQLEQVEILPLAAGLLSGLVEKGRHQQMLDALLDGLEKLVNDSSAIESVRDRIFAKLPSLLNLYRGEPIVMNKMIDAAKALIIEIRADSAHPVRTELDAYMTGLIERLRRSSEFASRLDAFKLDLLERAELANLAAKAWSALCDFIVRDVNGEDSRIRRQLGAIIADIGGGGPTLTPTTDGGRP